MIHAKLGRNNTAIQKQFMSIASLNNKMSRKTTTVIDSTHSTNKSNLCPRNK
jgi:hypothetical protein